MDEEYRQKPEVKEHMREYERKRGQTPEYKAWKKKYNVLNIIRVLAKTRG